MSALIVRSLHGRPSFAIEHCDDPRPYTGLAVHVDRVRLTDEEAGFSLPKVKLLWAEKMLTAQRGKRAAA